MSMHQNELLSNYFKAKVLHGVLLNVWATQSFSMLSGLISSYKSKKKHGFTLDSTFTNVDIQKHLQIFFLNSYNY